MRVINTGRAALNRAFKRHELESVPHILTIAVRKTARWALGTAARPEAVLELNSNQIDWENGLVDLLPEGALGTG